MRSEPKFETNKEATNVELGKALPYYKHIDDKVKKKWVLESFKDSKCAHVLKNLPDYHFSTVGTFVRMQSRGLIFSEKMNVAYNKLVTNLHVAGEEVVLKKVAVVVKPKQKKAVDKTEDVFAELEGQIDNFLKSKCKSKFNAKGFIKSFRLNKADTKKINEFYEVLQNELELLVDTSDEQLTEAYSFLSKPQKRKYLEFVTSYVDATEKKVEGRKPRRKKYISPEKRVSKLNFTAVDDGYGIKSINPEKIIGAKGLVTYNLRYDTIAIYSSTFGFSVKGSTLLEVDHSIIKKVRKPKEFLNELGGTFKKIKKQVEKLTTKAHSAKDRINKNTVLLKVF